MHLAALTGDFGDRADAVTVVDRTMSWADLQDAATRRARHFVGANAVAVLATTELDTVINVLAALQCGVPVIPVSPDTGVAERAHLLSDSGASLWVEGESVRELRPTKQNAFPSDIAFVLYTSGTTGAPKGVMVRTQAIERNLDLVAEAWEWTPDDVLAHGLPLFHVHGLILGVLGALRVGSRVIHTGRPTGPAYAAAGASLYFGVPTVWSRICADMASAKALRTARLLVSGSAPLPATVWNAMHELSGHRPAERYGLTEALVITSTGVSGRREPGIVGPALAGISTRIVNENGRPIEPGTDEFGELQVRSPSAYLGYLGQPEATASSYSEDGWLRTGDVATIDAEGIHRIVGRASTDMIKSGGHRIGADEIEQVLLAHPAVREAAVLGVPDDDLGERIVAFIVGDPVAGQVLIDHVATQLAGHKRPREVVMVDHLPRNALGKVLKKSLRTRR